MIVCDICKSSKCFEVKMPVVKTETLRGRTKDRTVIEPKLDLCEKCLNIFLSRVGSFVRAQREEGSPYDKDQDDGKNSSNKEGPEEGASTLEESATE